MHRLAVALQNCMYYNSAVFRWCQLSVPSAHRLIHGVIHLERTLLCCWALCVYNSVGGGVIKSLLSEFNFKKLISNQLP